MESVTQPNHLTFHILQTTLASARTVAESSRYHSDNQGQNLNHYIRIAMRRTCSYWNLHDTHYQWKLPGYIIHWEMIKNDQKTREKRKHSSSNHFLT